MAAGFHKSKQVPDRKIEARVYLYPNLRSDIPSLLPYSVCKKQVTRCSLCSKEDGDIGAWVPEGGDDRGPGLTGL